VAERDFSLDAILYEQDEQAHAPARPLSFACPNGDTRQFSRFQESNVQRQRQQGFSTVEVTVPRGDLTPEQLRGLAQIMREFTGGSARTNVHQNLVLRWVRDESVYDVWTRLVELDLGAPGADEITDVVSCPGTGLVQARDHQLDGPQPRRPGAPPRDGHHRPADAQDPHQDERLPERMQPASPRNDRLLRRFDEGR